LTCQFPILLSSEENVQRNLLTADLPEIIRMWRPSLMASAVRLPREQGRPKPKF